MPKPRTALLMLGLATVASSWWLINRKGDASFSAGPEGAKGKLLPHIPAEDFVKRKAAREAAEKAAREVGEEAGEGLLKKAGKRIAKFGANKIPIVGWGLAAHGAVESWREGDGFWGSLGGAIGGALW